jgi:hypothetical protein
MSINAPTNLNLAITSDSGPSNSDAITNVVRPVVTGRGTFGSTVTLFEAGVVIGSGVVASNGIWSIQVGPAFADGAHALTATATLGAETSVSSAVLAVVVDTSKPDTPADAPKLAAISDSGLPDQVTNFTRPILFGEVNKAELGSTVTLYDGATKVGSVVLTSDTGAWSIIPSAPLADGVHNLTVTVTDKAGNVSGNSPAQTVEIRTHAETPPALVLAPGKDTGASDSDHITKATDFSFNGTAAAGSAIELKDSDGTRVGTATALQDGTWTVDRVLLGEGEHNLTAVVTDLINNTATSAPLHITVDTTAPQTTDAPLLDAGSDSGRAQDDGLTNVATPLITGTAEAGATVALFEGKTQVGSAVADKDGNWSVRSAALADGDHGLHVTVTDLAGNTSSQSRDLFVAIDTQAPAVPAAPVLDPLSDSGRSGTDGVTNVATPPLSGLAEAGAVVTLFDGGKEVATAVAGSEGAWSINDVTLADGAHSLTVRATDAAGNVSEPSPALALTIDTGKPVAPGALDLLAGSDSGASDTDNITNATLPVIAGNAEANAIVTLFDGDKLIGSVVADGEGHWQITPTQALANGVHNLTATATDVAGNVSDASEALGITIDTRAAVTPTGLALTAQTDSGTSNHDGITNSLAPAVTGNAEAGATINLFEGATKLGTAVADESGVWTVAGIELGEGAHHLTASGSSLTGTVSAPSAELVVTIDRSAPDAPASPVLTAQSDSGAAGDGVTNVAAPTLHGTAEVGVTVALFDGATQVGSGVADGNGAWTITTGTLIDGAHSLTVKATDVAGNVSEASAALALIIDTQAPEAPTGFDLVAGSDSGVSNSDNITNDTTPTLTGSAEPGSTVLLFDGAVRIASTVTDATGHWQYTPETAIASRPGGLHNLFVKAVDAAGNVSGVSAAIKVTIDTTAPTAPSDLDLADGSDSGVSNTDNITSALAPVVSGKAEAGATIDLFDGGNKLGSAVADESGAWRIAAGELREGVRHLTAVATDVAGNVSTPSAELVVTIDRGAPDAPAAPALAAPSDSGTAGDNVTNVATPELHGTAEVGATVALFDGATQVGSAVADKNGAWTITSGTLTNDVHNLTVKATDVAGNVSEASAALALTIDTKAPDAPAGLDLLAGSDNGVSDSDDITGVTVPVIAGSAEVGATVALFDDGKQVGSVVAGGDGHWRITPSQALANGVHNLTATATDVAGNVSEVSAGLKVTVDTTVPTKPGNPDLAVGSDSGVSNTDNITNVATPTITGNADAGAMVTLFDGGIKLATVAANAAGVWSVDNIKFADGVHHLAASTSSLTGVASPLSDELAVTIDTARPDAPAAPVLSASSDSGVAGDNITNDATPELRGTAEAGATVALFDGATQVGSAVADGSGAWTITSGALIDGAHNLTVKATDLAGNVSDASPALSLTIDTLAPAAPGAPDLVDGSDNGVSNTDNNTNVTLPTFAGQAEAKSGVALYDGATLVGSGVADDNGNWQITVTQPLVGGPHSLTATSTDAAGNTSALSGALSVTITTATLAAPTALDLATASDSGSSNSDNVTSVNVPLITGKVAVAGATVILFDGATKVGTAVANTSGVWSVNTSTLADGVHHLTAVTTDVAGNVSPASAELVVTIDTTAAVTTLAVDATSDSGRSNTDGITNDTTPLITGTTEARATVALFEGTKALGTAVADANGLYSITSTALTTGLAHSLTVKATDIAGNVSTSAPLAVTIDTTAPSTPAIPDLTDSSDKGSSITDNITNFTLPTLAGKAEANAIVSLYDATTLVGTGLADASGNWQITLTQPLTDGAHSFNIKATDVAGNVSAQSTSLAVTIDTAAPLTPTGLDLATASDTGLSNVDNVTNIATPNITGKIVAATTATTINLYDGGTLIGTTVVAANATSWSIAKTATLGDGVHHLTATATDVAGNVSAPTAELVLTIDTLAPAAPSAPVLDQQSESGNSMTDGITNINTPHLTGAAEAGATVTLFNNGVLWLTTTADAVTGAWSVTPTAAQALTEAVHNITAQATDLAGNVLGSSPALVLTIDKTIATPAAPDLLATSDSGVSGSDNLTNVVLPTLAGKTEANAGVALYDGATLVGSGVADASGNWQITVTQALGDGTHSFTTQSTDVAGNISAKSPALSVIVDTTAPLTVPTALDLLTASDKGASNSDNITSLAAPTVTGKIAASAAAVTVGLFDGATLLGSVSVAANATTWSIPSTVQLTDDVHHLTARTIDAAGNLSAPSDELVVTIDTLAPVASAPILAAASDSGRSNADNVTNVTKPVLTGVTEAGATVTLFDSTTAVGTVVADGNGAWSLAPTSALLAGVHNLNIKITDVAGNISGASPALAVTIDTAPPSAPTTLDLQTASDNGVSTTDNITSIVLPTLAGKAEINAIVSLYEGTTLVGTGLADTSGNWQITLTQPLADGVHTLNATATDLAGNTSGKSTSINVTVDTAEPAPTALALASGSDSGVSASDQLTNVALPGVTGKIIATGAATTIKLYDGDVLVGTTVVAANATTWTIATTVKLTDAVHHLTAVSTDAAGNVSAPSAELVVTIDTTPPLAGTVAIDALSDSGVSNTDGITNDATPLLTGTSEKGAAMTLFDGSTLIGSAVADGNGAWSFAAGTLAEGKHSLTVKASDAAGNVAVSPVFVATIDTKIAQPGLPDLATASDNGASSTDNLTGITTPLITGTAEAGATVTLLDGGKTLATVVANASGVWQAQLSSIGEGVHQLTSQATDAAGNVSLPSAVLTLTIDSHADKPGKPDLADASDSGLSNADNITKVTLPTLNGTAEAGSTVTLFDGDVVLASVKASATGAWTYTFTKALVAGAHSITATATDLVGNISDRSEALGLTIDTTTVKPGAPVLDPLSDSGASNTDLKTNDNTPHLTGGGAEANATINLFDGTKLVGTAQADDNGAWSMTAQALAEGARSLTITATDAAGNVSLASTALALTIDTIAPVVTDANSAANVLNIGTMKNGDLVGLTASGAGTGGTYSLVSNPDNLFSINATTGVVTLANSASLTTGAHAVTIQGVDVAGNIGTGVFNIVGDTPPTISGIANTTFDEDHKSPTLSFTIGDAETSAANLTLSSTSSNGLIGGFTFGGSGANRTLTLTPSTDGYGTDTITVTVKDADGLTSTSTFVATVRPVDDPTTANSDIYGTTEQGRISVPVSQLLANDTDVDVKGTVQSVSSVSGGTAVLSGTNVIFTAAANAHGLGHYTYTNSDNNTANVWVKLAPIMTPISTDKDFTFEIQEMYVGYFGRPPTRAALMARPPSWRHSMSPTIKARAPR